MLAGVVIVPLSLLAGALPDAPGRRHGPLSFGVYIAVVAGIRATASGVLEVLGWPLRSGRGGQQSGHQRQKTQAPPL
ncbi:MAG: hypothetical protein CM15mP79_2560 [Methanobacteriota archaeon]|nr:MAG: hypothetical protein CM15mP79_2560 [Euryarchaeota archaeon]